MKVESIPFCVVTVRERLEAAQDYVGKGKYRKRAPRYATVFVQGLFDTRAEFVSAVKEAITFPEDYDFRTLAIDTSGHLVPDKKATAFSLELERTDGSLQVTRIPD